MNVIFFLPDRHSLLSLPTLPKIPAAGFFYPRLVCRDFPNMDQPILKSIVRKPERKIRFC